MVHRMGIGIMSWFCLAGISGGKRVLLTDARHLDDPHLSRPECRRTELSPEEDILKEREWAWLQICATYNCLMGMAKIGRRWLSDTAKCRNIYFYHPNLLKPCSLNQSMKALTISHRCYHPFPRKYVKRL